MFMKFGLDVRRRSPEHRPAADDFPVDFDQLEMSIIREVRQFTMTSPERIVALIRALQYVVNSKIPGDIVECGVWKGGSMMAAAMALNAMNNTERQLYLFDTFDGMSEPGKHDISIRNESASELLENSNKDEETYIWAYSPLENVKKHLYSTGYDPAKLHFIKGRVEETLPSKAPDKISLLRLDTDWYESTRHELHHLYPRLSPGGVIIIDDYGHWKGARKATEEYLHENGIRLFLARIDYTGRIGVKT